MMTQPAIEPTEESLVIAARDNDRKAQYELYNRYARAMFNIACRMMNKREEAEDILQESFVSAFQNMRNYRFDSTFGAWLKRIVINQCINALKKKQLALAELDESRVEEVEDSTEEEAIDSYKLDKVRKAISRLPDGYRTVLTLYLIEGYDHQEIAEILSLSESTSKTQYFRAKKRLKTLLKEDQYEG